MAVLLLVGALCIFRSFYGFDWSDETYYSALPYRFLTGDSLFVNSWDIHQMGALIALPLVALFRVFSAGSMEGVLLFMRLMYVVCAVLAALYAFHVIKKSAIWAAVVSAVLIVLFVPGGTGTFSYNTQALLLTGLSWFLLMDAEQRARHRLRLFLGGACFALAVQSYPYLVILLPIYIVFFVMFRIRKKQNGSAKNAYLFWILGMAAVCVAFMLFVLINSSLANLFQNLKYLLSDPEHPAKDGLADLREYTVSIFRLFGAAGVGVAAVTAAALVVSFVKEGPKKQTAKMALQLLVLVVMVWSLLRIWAVSAHNATLINLLVVPLVVIGPAVFLLSGRKYHPSVWLYAAGWAFSIAVNLGSNNELNHSAYPLTLSAIAVVVYCGVHLKDIKTAGVGMKLAAALGAVVLLVTMAGVGYVRTMYIYRDERLPLLTTRMESGPAAGIYTTEQSASQYEEVVASINTYAPDSGTAFYTKLLPFGYLCTDLRAATPSLWRTRLDSPRLAVYYKLYPKLRPDFVFVVNEAYGITNGDNSMQGELSAYIGAQDYNRIILDCGTIYVRQPDKDKQ